MSEIEYEITFKSNPLFVFHDSRGIEAGTDSYENSKLRLDYVLKFIDDRSRTPRLKDQLHAIWYELLKSLQSPTAHFELGFASRWTTRGRQVKSSNFVFSTRHLHQVGIHDHVGC